LHLRHSPRPTARARSNCSTAASRDGATEALMIAHGFAVEQMAELVRAKLATATPERVAAGGAQASRSLGRGLRMKSGG
jgi:hypothetical protein